MAYYNDGEAIFDHQDWLGTERAQTTYDGQIQGTYSSLPFGDGFAASGNDWDALHFAGLDHDYESDTDHALYRQYSPTQGRWMSPDPDSASYDFANPQSLNRYPYVLNNPLSLVDPDGTDCVKDNGDGTITTNVGDCPNENEEAANREYYINCDGCTSGTWGAYLDRPTGTLTLTDSYGYPLTESNGNAVTVQGFAAPQGTPPTTATVNGYAPYLDTVYGWGIQPDIDSERIRQLAIGITVDSRHSFGCIARAYGIGAPSETLRYMGQPVEGSKPFVGNASKGTSPISEFLSGLNWKVPKGVRFPAPTGGPFTGKDFAMKASRDLGRQLGRWAPIVGWAGDIYAGIQLGRCL